MLRAFCHRPLDCRRPGVTITAEVTTTASSSTQFSNAYLVFDYVSATNYKLAGIETKNQVISQVSCLTYSRLAVADASITEASSREISDCIHHHRCHAGHGDGVADVGLSGSGFLTRNVELALFPGEQPIRLLCDFDPDHSPEINVHNGNIANNSTVPSTSNGTNFGSTTTTGNITRTFRIQNTGGEALTLTGAPAATQRTTKQTSVLSLSHPVRLQQAAAQPLTSTLRPGALGTRTASVSIANNDGDENPYNFAIQGTGSTEPTETKIVNDNFESTPIELATNTGFTIVTRGNGNKVFQSPAGTRNASSTVTPAISPRPIRSRIGD